LGTLQSIFLFAAALLGLFFAKSSLISPRNAPAFLFSHHSRLDEYLLPAFLNGEDYFAKTALQTRHNLACRAKKVHFLIFLLVSLPIARFESCRLAASAPLQC
jgi:hypothetical protein